MKKIIFIANVDCGEEMSGGSKIYIEFLKNWKTAYVYFFGSQGTIKRLQRENIKNIKYIETDDNDHPNLYSIFGVFKHFLRRTLKGMKSIKRNRMIINQAEAVYSASDFYPDLLSAFYAYLINKKIKWIAGYYLFAPNPFSKESPYKGKNRIRGFLYWLMQRPSYFLVKKFADFVLVTSEPDAKKFITQKRHIDRIIVVQGGVDMTEASKYLKSTDVIPVKDRRYDACFMGRFHYQKGVLELIDIWKKVCEKNKKAKLIMIGTGSLEPDTKQKIKELKLDDNISLVGFKDGAEKYGIFKQSKIIVHPATYDSGGMAAAEAMAWGLPGVSFDLESLKTYYPSGMIKTKRYNLQEFADNILLLLNDEKVYKKTSKEALDLITKVWDWNKRADLIYQKIFNNENQK